MRSPEKAEGTKYNLGPKSRHFVKVELTLHYSNEHWVCR